jgi:Rod binding domain-containing protein
MTDPASLLPTPLPLALPTPPIDAASLPQTVAAREAAKADAAANFESLLIAMLLKEMRQTTDGEGLFGGEASDTYGGLFDLYLSQHLAGAGGLGLNPLVSSSLETEK